VRYNRLNVPAKQSSSDIVAEMFRSWFESDDFWQEVARQHRTTGLLLRFREHLQKLARRHRGNPSGFLGGMLVLRQKVGPRKQQAFETIVELLTSTLEGAPVSEERSRQARQAWLALLAGDPGRPHVALYEEALALRRKRKTVHQICQRLVPGYGSLPATQRKAMRQRMDKGIKRAAERLSAGTTR
jgi:hypothetical protein